MYLHDLQAIGNRLLSCRQKAGLTQAQTAEAAGISERTYADIERGSANMRLTSLVCICEALHISPNELLSSPETAVAADAERQTFDRAAALPEPFRRTAAALLNVYIGSLSGWASA